MLSELNEAFDRATRDDSVRVMILAADGHHFSSGHDLRAGTDMTGIDPIGTWCCFGADGAEGYMATEAEMYVGLCWRWRNIPKPTIAQVQGKVIAGGLMLVWPMDLVVCSEDATFAERYNAPVARTIETLLELGWDTAARRLGAEVPAGSTDLLVARREAVVGRADRPATPEELRRMGDLVRIGMR